MDRTALVALLVIAGAAVYFLARSTDGEDDNSADLSDYAAQAEDGAESIFDTVDDMTAAKNTAAFLAGLRLGEGTAGTNGYQILMGGGIMDSYADHPANRGWRGTPLSDKLCALAGYGPGCVSTAAGAYQINKPTWTRLAAKLGLSDFSPASQDAAALQLIAEKGALGDVQAGRLASAIAKVSKVWASLPGAGYGQREVSLADFANQFESAGGLQA